MKICYTSDLHGEMQVYRQLFELARDSSAEIIALGGDLLPSLRGGDTKIWSRSNYLLSVDSFFLFLQAALRLLTPNIS